MKRIFLKDSLALNETKEQSLNTITVLTWFYNSASTSYQDYINSLACSINRTSPVFRFCLQDTSLSQSPVLGQLTVRSADVYQSAIEFLSMRKIHLVQ